MSTLGDPLPPPLSTFVNFWRPPPPAPWVDVNKVCSLSNKLHKTKIVFVNGPFWVLDTCHGTYTLVICVC